MTARVLGERRITLALIRPTHCGIARDDGVRVALRHVTDLHHCDLIVPSRFRSIRFARLSKIAIAASLNVSADRESCMRLPPRLENGLRAGSVGPIEPAAIVRRPAFRIWNGWNEHDPSNPQRCCISRAIEPACLPAGDRAVAGRVRAGGKMDAVERDVAS
jgi:hypothetical protein